MIQVIIADDDRDAADALKRNIEGQDDIRVVAICENGKEAVDRCIELCPDIVLMDVRMPVMDGIEASRLIKQENEKIKILIMTLFAEKDHVIKAFQNFCDGYIYKGHKSEEIITIIRNTCNGLNTYDREAEKIIREHISGQYKQNGQNSGDISDIKKLTAREIDIARLITAGRKNSEISSELFLSEGHVRNTLAEIFLKVEVRNSKELAVWGAKRGL